LTFKPAQILSNLPVIEARSSSRVVAGSWAGTDDGRQLIVERVISGDFTSRLWSWTDNKKSDI